MSLSYRINPVTLKELRQMTRSRLVASGLIGFLLLQLIGVALMLLTARGELQGGMTLSGLALGQRVFHTVYFLLSAVLLFCVTLYVGFRMGVERGADHLDLQYTTALTPRQFVDGKIVSAVLLILVFSSAALPFMVLSYLLRGLDIFRVLLAFGLLLVAAVCSVYGALFLASVATTRLFRGVVMLVTIFFLLFLIGMVNAGGAALATAGWRLSFASWSDCAPAAQFLAACVTGCALARVASVAALAPPLSNRDLPLRLWFTGVWLAWGGIALLYVAAKSDLSYLGIWAVYGVTASAVLLCVCGSMASGISRRVFAAVSATRWRRFLQFPFFSGAENGMVWGLALGFFSVILLMAVTNSLSPAITGKSSLNEPNAGQVAVYFLYLSAYVCTVRAAWFFLLHKWVSHRFVGVISAALIVLGYALPYLLALGDAKTGKEVAWQFGNAFAVFDMTSFNLTTHMWYAAVWALLAWTACLPGFYAAFRRFHPPQAVRPD